MAISQIDNRDSHKIAYKSIEVSKTFDNKMVAIKFSFLKGKHACMNAWHTRTQPHKYRCTCMRIKKYSSGRVLSPFLYAKNAACH